MKKLILIFIITIVSCSAKKSVELERKSSVTTFVSYKNLPEKVETNIKEIDKLKSLFQRTTDIKKVQDNIKNEQVSTKIRIENILIELDDMLVQVEALKGLIDKPTLETSTELKAFPTAEGYGKYATGGRGGAIIKVTNLNSSGAGSLRAALETSGTRTIIFTVGGTIDLGGNVDVDNGNLTIAGQTAPGGGILIKGGMIEIQSSNVVVRYVRVRPGPTAPSGADGIGITAWSGTTVENIIIDHCSISWADDENFNIRGIGTGRSRNITLQNSIISENTYGTLLSSGVYNVSILNNLFALNSERSIRANLPVSGEFEFEMINNLVYGFRSGTKPSYGTKFSVVGNHYKLSSQVTPFDSYAIDASSTDQGTPSETYVYEHDNLVTGSINKLDTGFNSYDEETPFAKLSITPISSSSLSSIILSTVGCNYPIRDSVDDRIIDNWNDGDGVIATSGTYPTISNGTAYTDTDDDGMDDTYETSTYGSLSNTNNGDEDGDDYTNLEEFLNQIN